MTVRVAAGRADDFPKELDAALARWRANGITGVWLEVPPERADRLPAALARGFELHSAEQDHVLLAAWLPPGPSPLPPNATHQVGVGAVVVDSKTNRILVVVEEVGPAAQAGARCRAGVDPVLFDDPRGRRP